MVWLDSKKGKKGREERKRKERKLQRSALSAEKRNGWIWLGLHHDAGGVLYRS